MKKQWLASIAFTIALVSLAVAGVVLQPQNSCAEEAWKTEFNSICSKTDDAMALSIEENKKLVERCDKLKVVLETLDESTRKVYVRRLQMCRDLFAFVVDSQTQNNTGGADVKSNMSST